jgi:LuxR family maltose regulon positive regulatory protein
VIVKGDSLEVTPSTYSAAIRRPASNIQHAFVEPPKWNPVNSSSTFIPRISRNIIARFPLETKLETASSAALALIVAPAGFGKTTLLASWLKKTNRRTAWFSIEERESSLESFAFHLLAALQQALGELSPDVRKIEPSIANADWKTIASTFIYALSEVSEPTTIILDDYQLVVDERVHALLARIISKLPENVHVIISSRTTPPLPLSRLRAQGLLREIEAESLRFTEEESDEFLLRIMHLKLSPYDLSELFKHTEGWIVGLQLAAIGLQEGANVFELVSSNYGQLQHSLVYLLEEVLNRQPGEVREFLVQTSILDRLSGTLCDYVTRKTNSKYLLDKLFSENLFIVSLDDTGEFYRYHYLFRSLLLQQLTSKFPEIVPTLRARASAWYEESGYIGWAVSCAVSNADWQRVADLIETLAPIYLFQTKDFRDWLSTLPKDAIMSHPRLANYQAWSSLIAGDIKTASRLFDYLLTVVKPQDPSYIQVALIRSVISYMKLDGRDSLLYAQHAFEVSADQTEWRSIALSFTASAHAAAGNGREAERLFADGIDGLLAEGVTYFDAALRFYAGLASVQATNGRLDDAMATLLRMKTLADHSSVPYTPFVHMVGAYIYIQRDELDLAEEQLQVAHQVMQNTGIRFSMPQFWHVTVLLGLARGDYDSALEAADEMRGWCRRHGNDGWYQVAEGLRARALLELGRLDNVKTWLKSRAVYEPTNYSYRDEQNLLILVRWTLYQTSEVVDDDDLIRAAALAQRITDSSKQSGRLRDGTDAQLLRIMILHRLGRITEALTRLNLAAAYFLPQGAVRLFRDHRKAIEALLIDAGDEVDNFQHLRALSLVVTQLKGESPHLPQHLLNNIFTISDREQEVLNQIANGLTNTEIAESLYVSLNTVKTHIKNLYFKLDVHSRTQALAIARRANLI